MSHDPVGVRGMLIAFSPDSFCQQSGQTALSPCRLRNLGDLKLRSNQTLLEPTGIQLENLKCALAEGWQAFCGGATGMALAAATLVRMCVRSEAVAVRVARGAPTFFAP